MVKLILCIHRNAGPAGRQLRKTIRERFAKIQQEHHDGVESFHRRLCLPIRCKKLEICIVLADSHERLERLVELKALLEDRQLVLILPDNQKDVFSKGHQLLPRYVSTLKDNNNDLMSVLEKMIAAANRCDRDEKKDEDGN